METIIIVAMTPEGLIGRDGGLPWHIPADLKHFKHTTTGHAVIMGRKTFDSVGKPLPGRRNIVVTRNPAQITAVADDARGTALEAVKSLQEGLQKCEHRGEEKAFIAGGAEIFALGLPLADEMVVTWVRQPIEPGAPLRQKLTFPPGIPPIGAPRVFRIPTDWKSSNIGASR